MREEARASTTRRRRLPSGCLILLLVSGLFVSFAGLSISGHDPRLLWYQTQRVDTLKVTYSARMLPPLPQVTTDAATIQALYTAAFALPAVDPFVNVNCGLGHQIVFHLAFARGKVIVALVDVDLSGCGHVSLAGIATRQVTQPFEKMLASAESE